jgi:hypothetical protein
MTIVIAAAAAGVVVLPRLLRTGGRQRRRGRPRPLPRPGDAGAAAGALLGGKSNKLVAEYFLHSLFFAGAFGWVMFMMYDDPAAALGINILRSVDRSTPSMLLLFYSMLFYPHSSSEL